MKPRCGKCRFSDVDVFSDSDDRGLCRRFPPVCEVHFKDDWCGEFQTKPVKKTKLPD